jgi:asparagine synthase (glutamine-hydrolysing)
MCGIAGAFNFRSGADADRRAVVRMTESMAHRGPDAHDTYAAGPIALGHRRLAIIDLSERGRQPMSYLGGRFVIVFNGEIYNYLELRHELEQRGHQFATDTDTEVLLASFAAYGDECVERLNGMFAFAIWDAHARRLFMARDRVGIKPLYYTVSDEGIRFASEAKALFEYGDVAAEVDRELIPTYMAFGYVPGERSLFKGVRKLLPGHTLCAADGRVEVRPYWELPSEKTSSSPDEIADELRALLLDATRLQLRSDVPIGVFLSGGVDSSAIVSLVKAAGTERVKTFSVAYAEGREFDETEFAMLVARRFGTEHHVLHLDSSRFADFIPQFAWHMDEPVIEAAAISLYFIARQLREHVTVALSGEGSDELFGGYDIYRYMQWTERLRRVPKLLRTGLLNPALRALGQTKALRYSTLASLPLEERYLGVPLLDAEVRDRLLADAFEDGSVRRAGPAALAQHYAATAGQDPLSRMLRVDLKTWLVDDLLIKADKMTMATGVELRVPFLDHRVVEFATRVPSRYKIRGSTHKWILKKALGAELPIEVVKRPKMGFPTPLARMFQRDLGGYVRDTLLSRTALDRGYFRPDVLGRLVDEHLAGAHDHHKVLWQLIVLEEWHRAFLDRPAAGRAIA